MAVIAADFLNYDYWLDRLDATLKSLDYRIVFQSSRPALITYGDTLDAPVFSFGISSMVTNDIPKIFLRAYDRNTSRNWRLAISPSGVQGELDYLKPQEESGRFVGIESYINFENDVESGLAWLLSRCKDQTPLQMPMTPWNPKKSISWTNWLWSWLGFEKID